MRLLPAILASMIAAVATEAPAGQVDGIGPAVGRLTALRGGVLLVPLSAEVPGTQWPSSVDLLFEDGERLLADVIWIHRRPWSPRRRWTDDASGLAVRMIRPTDDSGAPADGGTPFAIVQVQPGRAGDFTVIDARPQRRSSGQPVRPTWVDPESIDASWNVLAVAAGALAREGGHEQEEAGAPVGSSGAASPPSASSPRGALERREDLALPDPSSPFEHFRWVLMAHRMELEPPPPPGHGVESLLARHGAEMWSIGLGRLAAQSPGVAAACADTLTSTALDGDRRVASWLTDWVETNALLSLLLDTNKRDRAVLDAALGWAESRDPVVLWPEQDQGSIVAVAAMNTLVRDVTLTGIWAGAEANPASRTVHGGELGSVNFARPPVLATDPLQRTDPRRVPLSLLLEFEGRRRTIPAGPAVTDAAPPGVPLPQFRPALRLSEARSGMQEAVPAQRTTAGMLRKSRGRWEIFVECGRPPRTGGAADVAARLDMAEAGVAADLPRELAALRERGLPIAREAIVHSIGPRERPRIMLAIPEEGEAWLLGPPSTEPRRASPVPGADDEGGADGAEDGGARALPHDLEIHRRSLPTVWRCRIVLPQEWLPALPIDGSERAPLLLGMTRTHGGDEAIENAGLPQVPWDPWPAPIAIGLERWEE